MSKHTPGPWRHRRSAGHFAVTAGTLACCDVVAVVDTEENAEAEADARLISAAPDLLRIAERAQGLLELLLEGDPPSRERMLLMLRDTTAALAKADAS